MDKKKLSEADICAKFITPALNRSGWGEAEQVYREYTLRPGRVVVRGQKASRDRNSVLRADYVLFYKTSIPLAVIEAKDNSHAVGAGMAQAISYAALLGVPFSFASNGDGFVFRDATVSTGVLETSLALDQFPSLAELWERLCTWKGWTPEVRQLTEQPYAPSKTPRYYQLNAINRTVEAIARGQQRALLVMATGTGKTYTAFQIIWRLWKSGAAKRILFLADRNILIDQTMVNDFRPFKGAMAKLSPNAKGVERLDASTGKRFIEELGRELAEEVVGFVGAGHRLVQRQVDLVALVDQLRRFADRNIDGLDRGLIGADNLDVLHQDIEHQRSFRDNS